MRFILSLVVIVISVSACSDLLSVSNSGTMVIGVGDSDTGLPIADVTVTAHLRDEAGQRYDAVQTTGSDGTTSFEVNYVGRISATVTPPPGYEEGSTGLNVELVMNLGTTVNAVVLLQKVPE
jgi:hypothetical protein